MAYTEADIQVTAAEDFFWVAYAEPLSGSYEKEYFVWEGEGRFEDLFLMMGELGDAAKPVYERSFQISPRGDNLVIYGRFAVSDYPRLAGREIEEANVDVVGGTSEPVMDEFVREELGEEIYDRIRGTEATANPQ